MFVSFCLIQHSFLVLYRVELHRTASNRPESENRATTNMKLCSAEETTSVNSEKCGGKKRLKKKKSEGG